MGKTLLAEIGKSKLFHTSGKPDLRHGVHCNFYSFYDVQKELSDAQLLALTLNEICVQQGKGLFLWFPDHAQNVNEDPDMLYYGKQWTEHEKDEYWNKTQIQRLWDAEVESFRLIYFKQKLPGPMVTAFNVKIFRASKDDDIIKWQVNTKGNLILVYRDGAIHFGMLHRWEHYAKWTAVSDFASMSASASARVNPENGRLVPTSSWHVRWGDVAAHDGIFKQYSDNESVVRVFNAAYVAVITGDCLM